MYMPLLGTHTSEKGRVISGGKCKALILTLKQRFWNTALISKKWVLKIFDQEDKYKKKRNPTLNITAENQRCRRLRVLLEACAIQVQSQLQ